MPATPLRSSRPAFAVALAALAGLLLTVAWRRPPPADVPKEAPRVHMAGWGVPELIRHLEERGLGLCAVPSREGGPLSHNAFLTVPGKRPEDLAGLIKTRAHIARWAGVVYCERSRGADGVDLLDLWGDFCLRAGPFWFFGDRELLARIHEALLDPAAPRDAVDGRAFEGGRMRPEPSCAAGMGTPEV
jgi:hypothetical protein